MKPKKKKHPSPKQHPTFKMMWEQFLPEIMKRDNFKPVHLHMLSILCDLYVELEYLQDFVTMNGYSYEAAAARGTAIISRPYVEVAQLNKARADILKYSKGLGLVLNKDTDSGEDDPEEDDFA